VQSRISSAPGGWPASPARRGHDVRGKLRSSLCLCSMPGPGIGKQPYGFERGRGARELIISTRHLRHRNATRPIGPRLGSYRAVMCREIWSMATRAKSCGWADVAQRAACLRRLSTSPEGFLGGVHVSSVGVGQ
jgi:hypothetical protein